MSADFFTENEPFLWILGVISIVTFIGSLIIVPYLIVRIPADYFTTEKRTAPEWMRAHPIIRHSLRIGKNALGGILIIMGIAMLVLPGQGILTILMGIILIDFPNKFRFERWLIQLKPVLATVKVIRKRANKAELIFNLP